MRTRLDVMMLIVAALQAAFGAFLLIRPQLILDLWPFPGTTELTFLFLASIFAAAAGSTAWSALLGEPASYVGIALDYLAIFGPMAAYLIVLEPARGGGASAFLLALVVTCGFGVWLFWRTYRLPLTDRRPTPRPLLASFVAFVLLLLVTSGVLLANVPNILPWLVTPELSVIAGLIFLGAATYFAYALLRRGWSNAGGQLAGFLAYDLVLILPLLARIPSVPDKWRLSLVVYIAILLSSGTLAAWYLFVNRVTRISNRRPPFEGR